MAAIAGNKRTLIYLYNQDQSVNELALIQAPIMQSLYGNSANYIVPDVRFEYITYVPVSTGLKQTALLYELYLTSTGDSLFTSANLATLASQLGLSSPPPTWTENISWGA